MGSSTQPFFYMLLWIHARRGWKNSPPKNSTLTTWYSGAVVDIANAKLGHMTKSENKGFGFIMREFPPGFDMIKPLSKAIWDILFPYKDGEWFTGTLEEPEVLIEPIIKAFDGAIANLIGEASE